MENVIQSDNFFFVATNKKIVCTMYRPIHLLEIVFEWVCVRYFHKVSNSCSAHCRRVIHLFVIPSFYQWGSQRIECISLCVVTYIVSASNVLEMWCKLTCLVFFIRLILLLCHPSPCSDCHTKCKRLQMHCIGHRTHVM